MRKGNWVNLTSQKKSPCDSPLYLLFLVLRYNTKQDWKLKAYSRSKMVMQIEFARFINFPMAISIEVGFMNPLPTKCSRQFCMQVQEGKNFAKFCFSFVGYRGGRGKFKMPRFLSSEKSEVRRKKSREENDYGSIASLLRNEVSTKDKNHWKSLIFNQLQKSIPERTENCLVTFFFAPIYRLSNTQPILWTNIDFIWDFL